MLFFLSFVMLLLCDLFFNKNKMDGNIFIKFILLIYYLFFDMFYADIMCLKYLYLTIPALIISDLISGIVHFFGDNILFDDEHKNKTKINKYIYDYFLHDFQNHHINPYDIYKKKTLFYNIKGSALIILVFQILITNFMNKNIILLNFLYYLFYFFLITNIIHRWSHLPKKRL
jgi:hypothetical protein